MITIITPCYNSEKSIERSILSVLQQKKKVDIEYIVVDASSKDGTLDIINRFRDKIDMIISEPDHGISDAYNKGILAAHGDLIGIVAADDRLVPNVLLKVQDEYKNESDIFVGNNISDVGTCRFRLTESDRDLDSLRFRMSLCHPSMLISRKAYEKYGLYSLNYKSAMDRELALRFYLKEATFQFSKLYINIFTSYGGISTRDTSIPNYEDDKISELYGMPHDDVLKYRQKKNKERNSFKNKCCTWISYCMPELIKNKRAQNNPSYIFESDIQRMYV